MSTDLDTELACTEDLISAIKAMDDGYWGQALYEAELVAQSMTYNLIQRGRHVPRSRVVQLYDTMRRTIELGR